MKKLIKLFFIVLISLCSCVQAIGADHQMNPTLDKYRIYVTHIDEEFHCLALSNGMVCNLTPSYWRAEKSLEIGDAISLLPIRRHPEKKSLKEEGEFYVYYGKGNFLCKVWMNEESKPSVLSYVSKSSVCQQKGWFFSEVCQDVIELSDGSKWEVLNSPFNVFAKKGDRVLAIPLLSSDSYVLINIDQLSFYEDDSETTVIYKTAEIKSYQENESLKNSSFEGRRFFID